MGGAFSKKKPLKEVLRENKRMITRAIRELDRERTSLEREEKKLTIEIKKMAKENQMNAVKIMAKDLVRTRAHVTKFIEMRSHLQSCGLKLQTVKSHQAMGEAMKNTTKAMVGYFYFVSYFLIWKRKETKRNKQTTVEKYLFFRVLFPFLT
jgi:charged multivesicular body protein 2A